VVVVYVVINGYVDCINVDWVLKFYVDLFDWLCLEVFDMFEVILVMILMRRVS